MSHAAHYLEEITRKLRKERLAKAWSVEAVATNKEGQRHDKQLAFIRDTALYQIALCSRRAGKSVANCAKLAFAAMTRPGRVFLYFGATKAAVWLLIWEPVWKEFCRKWKLPVTHNETRMVTTFSNGSVVAFTGTDDTKHVETYLGGDLGGAIIDEAQSQPDSLLVPLASRILPNALLDHPEDPGFLVMTGTIPDVAAGFFMKTWKAAKWSRHNWNRFENVFLSGQAAMLDKLLEANPGLTILSPEIRREWFGEFKFDMLATAYRYNVEVNGYRPEAPEWLEALFDGEVPDFLKTAMAAAKLTELPFNHWTKDPGDGEARFGVMASKPRPGITRFAGATDPGTTDRASVSVIGWGEHTEEVQHVFEFSTPRGADTSLGKLACWMSVAEHYFGCDEWRWDPGAGKMEIDTFQGDYGLPVIKAANKTETAGQIRRVRDLQTRGLLKTMIGSAAEQDYTEARRDPDAPPAGPWKWAHAWHPDPSESKRYAIQGYWAAFTGPPEKPKTVPEKMREALQRRLSKPQREKDAEKLGFVEVDMGDIWED